MVFLTTKIILAPLRVKINQTKKNQGLTFNIKNENPKIDGLILKFSGNETP